MNRYDRNFRGYSGAPRGADRFGGGRPPHGYAPEHPYDRPQVGGYRRYYQGGSGGIPTGPTPPGRYGSGDGWWSGKLGRDRYSSPYERATPFTVQQPN
ncbi:MAG TPA: hypothetical protein VFI91_02520 [Longimicrobiaceae bacterium]|nr:hypothetical protein [Longimicrobiaceae bacterium]